MQMSDADIDAFVLEREASPYNKLVLLAGVERQESFEIQVKVPVADKDNVLRVLAGDQLEITKASHYREYDTYFMFENGDPDAARLLFQLAAATAKDPPSTSGPRSSMS